MSGCGEERSGVRWKSTDTASETRISVALEVFRLLALIHQSHKKAWSVLDRFELQIPQFLSVTIETVNQLLPPCFAFVR